MPVFQVVSFSQVSAPNSYLHRTSPIPIRATCPVYFILFDFNILTILGEQYRSLSSSLCSVLHSPVTSSLLNPKILLNTLFWNTLSLRSALNVRDQISNPYKTTGKFTFLYILIFTFLDRQNILHRAIARELYYRFHLVAYSQCAPSCTQYISRQMHIVKQCT